MDVNRRNGLGLILSVAFVGGGRARATTYGTPTFMIYFPENSSAIPDESLEFVGQAQRYYDAIGGEPEFRNRWYSLVGGVDGAEFARGRQGLALKRAHTVAQALQDLGLRPGVLYPTVRRGPTPFEGALPGKPEQLNRAVRIDLLTGMAPITG